MPENQYFFFEKFINWLTKNFAQKNWKFFIPPGTQEINRF